MMRRSRPSPQTPGPASRTRRRRWAAALCSAILVIAFVLSGALGTVRTTVASWVDDDYATAQFTTAEVAQVQNLRCYDRDTLLNLLNRQVRLEWEPPPGLEGVPLEYVITWNAGLFGGSGTYVTKEAAITHEASGSLLSLRVRFTVKARIIDTDWDGDTVAASASGVTLIGLGVILGCND